MAVICPQCSLENPDDSAFCRRCGAALIEPTQQVKGGQGPAQVYVPPADTIIQQGFPSPSAYVPPVPPAHPPYEQLQPQGPYAPPTAAPRQPSIPLVTQLGKRAFA